jgi:hypothetical protein
MTAAEKYICSISDINPFGNHASVAQLVELLICNQWVGGSSPFAGFHLFRYRKSYILFS